MASERIDDAKVRRLILAGIGTCESIREARELGCNVIRVRDRVTEMCLPLAPRTVEVLMHLPWVSRIERRDLEQAASLGIIEGVDSYQPHAGTKVSTHLFWRIRKRVYEEIQANHWTIMRPPRRATDAYMKSGDGAMGDDERRMYLDAFLRPAIDPESDNLRWRQHEVQAYLTSQDLSR